MKKILLTLAAIVPLLACAQTDDIGLRVGVGAEKSLSRHWSVDVEGELRMDDNISKVDRFSIGADVTYKLNRNFKASAGYEFIDAYKSSEIKYIDDDPSNGERYQYSSYWSPRHRVHVDLVGSLKVGRVKLSLRERWQYTYRPSQDVDRLNIDQTDTSGDNQYGVVTQKEKRSKGENVLRSRLMAEYDIAQSPFTPYVSVEAYNAWSLQRVKYTAGTEYKFDRRNAMKVYYLFQDKTHRSSDDGIVQDQHVFGLSYEH